jgi:regulator of nucleoside diphosphate kinase
MQRAIYVTAFDYNRLQDLLNVAREFGYGKREDLGELKAELARAEVVDAAQIPPNVITMNSLVRLRDLDLDATSDLRLVFPREADAGAGRISVLAPLGTAMLGYRQGDEFEVRTDEGPRHFRVVMVLYQPEATGDYQL